MNMKWLKQTFAAIFLISVLVSCEYDYIEIAKPQPPDPGDTNNPVDTIFFSTQIEPLFASNNCTSCHGSGFFLDLTGVWCIGLPIAFFTAFYLKLPVYWVMALIAIEEIFKLGIGIPRFLSKKWIRNLVET